MSEQMEFPKTWEEYEKEYGFNDYRKVYTNNSRLIPSFRVKQWLDHLEQELKTDMLDKIKDEIKEWYWQADKQSLAKDPCVVDAMIDLFIRTIDKYREEQTDADSN